MNRKPVRGTSCPDPAFDAYLKADSLWPQVRYSITVGVLAALIENNGLATFASFASCIFSDRQINITIQSMRNLHGRAGIEIPEDRMVDLVYLDWERTKGAIVASLMHRLTGHPTAIGRRSLEDYAQTDFANIIEDFFSTTEGDSEKRIISQIVICARSVFERERSIAKIYALSMFSDAVRPMAYEKNQSFYEELIISQRIKGDLIANPILLRSSVVSLLVSRIKSELTINFPQEWFDWLFLGDY